MNTMTNYRCFNIKWETDGEDVELPNEVILTSNCKETEVYDFLSNALSNCTGWLHNGFEWEKI